MHETEFAKGFSVAVLERLMRRRDSLVNFVFRVRRGKVPQPAADETDAALLHGGDEFGIARFVIRQGLAEIADFGERCEPGVKHGAGALYQERLPRAWLPRRRAGRT